MLQAVLLGAAMGSSSAFVSPFRPSVAAAVPSSHSSSDGRSTVRTVGSGQMSTWAGSKVHLRSQRSRAVEPSGLQMVTAGIERGMFTTSRPEDRRVTPEFKDGKAFFKVRLMSSHVSRPGKPCHRSIPH